MFFFGYYRDSARYHEDSYKCEIYIFVMKPFPLYDVDFNMCIRQREEAKPNVTALMQPLTFC